MLCLGAMLLSLVSSCGSSKEQKIQPKTKKQHKPLPCKCLLSVPTVPTCISNAKWLSDLVYLIRMHIVRVVNNLYRQLQAFGATMYDQRADVVSYDGKILKARNIIGAYNPEAKKRVLLCAHWDSRPYADADKKEHIIRLSMVPTMAPAE